MNGHEWLSSLTGLSWALVMCACHARFFMDRLPRPTSVYTLILGIHLDFQLDQAVFRETVKLSLVFGIIVPVFLLPLLDVLSAPHLMLRAFL